MKLAFKNITKEMFDVCSILFQNMFTLHKMNLIELQYIWTGSPLALTRAGKCQPPNKDPLHLQTLFPRSQEGRKWEVLLYK